MRSLVVAVLIFLVTVFSSFTNTVLAADQTDDKPSPLIGLSRGQTARFNIVNIGGNNLRCDGNLMIVEADGSVLIERRFILDGGLAAFVDLPFSSLGRTDNRAEIRGIIINDRNNPNECFVAELPSLEAFDDATQVSRVIMFW